MDNGTHGNLFHLEEKFQSINFLTIHHAIQNSIKLALKISKKEEEIVKKTVTFSPLIYFI